MVRKSFLRARVTHNICHPSMRHCNELLVYPLVSTPLCIAKSRSIRVYKVTGAVTKVTAAILVDLNLHHLHDINVQKIQSAKVSSERRFSYLY